MKICITSSGKSLKSNLDPRFGRCAYFVIADTDKNEYEVIPNEAGLSGGGAGVSTGQLMVENGIQAIITGSVGPNAMSVLKAAQISIYKGNEGTIESNIESYKTGSLKNISDTVPPHSGMGKQS